VIHEKLRRALLAWWVGSKTTPATEVTMTGASSGALRHLQEVERRLAALDRALGALEDLHTMLGHPPGVAARPTHVEVMQDV
jgi:hypothetical protein